MQSCIYAVKYASLSLPLSNLSIVTMVRSSRYLQQGLSFLLEDITKCPLLVTIAKKRGILSGDSVEGSGHFPHLFSAPLCENILNTKPFFRQLEINEQLLKIIYIFTVHWLEFTPLKWLNDRSLNSHAKVSPIPCMLCRNANCISTLNATK